MLGKCKHTAKETFAAVEKNVLGSYYFSLSEHLAFKQRCSLLFYFFLLHLRRMLKLNKPADLEHEISALVYSAADERMLIPVLRHILGSPGLSKNIRINLLLFKSIPPSTIHQLRSLGCRVEKDHSSLLRACFRPAGKVVLLCLDQRFFYGFHRYGVDTADILKKFRVKTVSIQHGGSRRDSMAGLATSASDILLVFGEKIFADLNRAFRRDPASLRLTGNPLHDRLFSLNKEQTLQALSRQNPRFSSVMRGKHIIFFAGCLHDYYDRYPNAEDMYRQYVKNIYSSIDFTTAVLLAQSHPEDRDRTAWYSELIPDSRRDCILFLPSQPVGNVLDAYSLINAADLTITLASTLAEEALLLKKPVIAFDLVREGRTTQYRHLEKYPFYKTVYSDGKNALKDTIHEMLRTRAGEEYDDAEFIKNYAYKLDGRSTERAAAEILKEL